MSTMKISWMVFLLIANLSVLISSITSHGDHHEQSESTFIVLVSKSDKPSVFESHHEWYTSTLQSLPPSTSSASDNQDRRRETIYTYDHAVHGFAARLTPSQASHLGTVPGFISVIPERTHQFFTTRTPQFLDLKDGSGLWPSSNYGDDVIIGVLDSGIWPEHKSFDDSGLTPVPARWKGACEDGPDFPKTSCNRKLIGARSFYKGLEAKIGREIVADGTESRSPRDFIGHGTHCASTAAGSSVKNAGFGTYAVGDAKGIATRARIAAYKVGFRIAPGSVDSDILAAMDQAMADGVDIMSLSFGVNNETFQYFENVIAIGSFRAMEKGILVSCATGNAGPGRLTAANLAPWIVTVGASSIDREFSSELILGDGQVLPSVPVYPGDAPLDNQEIIFFGDNQNCAGALDPAQVTGKIVMCVADDNSEPNAATLIKNAGGIGMISIQTAGLSDFISLKPYPIPTAQISLDSAIKIVGYIGKQQSAGEKFIATIKFSETVGSSASAAPKVAVFSSRGPNRITPEILKPDIIAPGVSILAAWIGGGFNMQSGTSMACPHVSGLAAMLRDVYPKWSVAAIKSALMTTAYDVDNSGKYITDGANGKFSTPFQHGSGHVDPNRALNPGLVYDITPSGYEAFLCSIGYDDAKISLFVKDRTVDCGSIGLSSPGDLNYPSFSVVFKSGTDTVKYKRVVTNVGSSADAVYNLKARSRTRFVKISVSPTKLVFDSSKTSLSYEVTFTSLVTGPVDSTKEDFGSIEWYDGVHVVKSPVAFRWDTTTSSVSSI